MLSVPHNKRRTPHGDMKTKCFSWRFISRLVVEDEFDSGTRHQRIERDSFQYKHSNLQCPCQGVAVIIDMVQ